MIIEKTVEVFVPPPGPVRKIPAIGPITISEEHLLISKEDPHPPRDKRVLVSQAGQTHQLLLPKKETEAVKNQEVGVSLPVVEVDQLVPPPQMTSSLAYINPPPASSGRQLRSSTPSIPRVQGGKVAKPKGSKNKTRR